MERGKIRVAAECVRAARRIAVLTGAGVSTASGIPDFRSASGLYANPDNTNVFDLDAFHKNPALFYNFARTFYPLTGKAQPNAAHHALARWQKAGREIRIATQNVDDLHERAGSRHVYHVHGGMEGSTCLACAAARPTRELLPEILAGSVPRCACGGVFKPDIVFFGEMLPESDWERAREAMASADLVLVLGTSLAVQPASSLPDFRRPGAGLVVVNRDPAPLDAAADVILRGDLAATMAAMMEMVDG